MRSKIELLETINPLNEEAILDITDFAEQVAEGNVQACAIVYIDRDNLIHSFSYSVGKEPMIIGGLEWLKSRILDVWN